MAEKSSFLRRSVRSAAVVVGAAAMVAAIAVPAQAAKGSNNTKIGGAKLTANIWIQNQADKNGCGKFEASSVVSGSKAPRKNKDWVRNTTSFDAWGIAASVTAFGDSGGKVSKTWTNNNGSRGSYQGGNVCVNWRTLYLDTSTTASALYYGVNRSVSANARW